MQLSVLNLNRSLTGNFFLAVANGSDNTAEWSTLSEAHDYAR